MATTATRPSRQPIRLKLTNTWKQRLHTAGRGSGRIVLAVLVVASSVSGLNVVWHWIFPPPPPPIAEISRHVHGEQELAAAFGLGCVTDVLTASATESADLSRCFPFPDKRTLPSTPGLILSNPVAFAAPKGPDVGSDVSTYSVTIGVTQQHYPTDTPVWAYYQIPVSLYAGYAPRAIDNLSPVGPPPPGVDIELAYPVAISNNSALASTLSGFITCYLTSQQGLERFVTTDSGLRAIGGYASATVTTVAAATNAPDDPADGTTLRVHVTVSAHTVEYTPYDWSYSLTMRATGGAWFVAAIDLIPALSSNVPDPAPTK